jgi:Fe-Mn family superoxide dismutase
MSSTEEIAPRPLAPGLLRLDGISRATMEAQHRVYAAAVAKRNEIVAALAAADRDAAHHLYSPYRELKLELTSALAEVKGHEVFFGHLGGAGGDPAGAFARLADHAFGSVGAWRDDFRATAMASRGWAFAAYDWDERRLANHIGEQGAAPVWNATPLVALDVCEHAYAIDYQTDRTSYVDAFLENVDWDVVNGWIAAYAIPL